MRIDRSELGLLRGLSLELSNLYRTYHHLQELSVARYHLIGTRIPRKGLKVQNFTDTYQAALECVQVRQLVKRERCCAAIENVIVFIN